MAQSGLGGVLNRSGSSISIRGVETSETCTLPKAVTNFSSLAMRLHSFLCSGRCDRWQSTPQYRTDLQAVHVLRGPSVFLQFAQMFLMVGGLIVVKIQLFVVMQRKGFTENVPRLHFHGRCFPRCGLQSVDTFRHSSQLA